jgi:uncharacterized membrane protein YfcA
MFLTICSDFSAYEAAIFCASVFIVGFSKNGFPGGTILAVPLMAMIVSPKESVGVLLIIYMMTDFIAVFNYWRYANLNYCFPYLIFVIMGVTAASFILNIISNEGLLSVIGWATLFAIILNKISDHFKNAELRDEQAVPKPSITFSAFFGLSVGLFSALANAGGPMSSLYMLKGRLDKFAFLGSTAINAIVMNCVKLCFFVYLGIIDKKIIKLSLFGIPMIIIGSFAGIKAAKLIPQTAFRTVVLFLAFIAALRLILI